MKKDFSTNDYKKYIPVPVLDAFPDFKELYDKAWELARAHVRNIGGMPQNPYMDEAFCDTQVWIWDTCFMSLFCKFAPEAFPGVETFKNFYEVLYGGGSLPKIIPNEREPEWTGATPGIESDIYIHIADNPPLFAWAEYENMMLSADKEHIRDLLYNKMYLQKHYEWIESLKKPEKPKGVFHYTCLIAEELGYRWEGGRSGMDNTPRGRDKIRNGKERPNNPDMLWLDAICQQALAAKMISELYSRVDDKENSELWSKRFEEKKTIVNTYYWDDEDKFYYDIDVNTHEFYKVKTVASYWTLTAGIATPERAEALAAHLKNPETFGGDVPLISLAKNDGDYYPDGRYWRGGLWLPTAYAAIRGLCAYGFHKEAHTAAVKIINHMLSTYKSFEPHTIWECYAPESFKPAIVADGSEYARPDFCGWSALGPIAMLIENVIGISEIDAFGKTVKWQLAELSGNVGIKNLRFGDVITDIVANGGVCTVNSNAEYTLLINGKAYDITCGTNKFNI